MQRMVNDYYERFYNPLLETGSKMREDGYKYAHKLVNWKHKISQAWDNISVDKLEVPDPNKGAVAFGENFVASITLNIPDLEIDDIGVEILMGNRTNGHVDKLSYKQGLEPVSFKDGKATYACDFPIQNAGVHDYAFRIYPKHPDLVYRMDFPLVKWV